MNGLEAIKVMMEGKLVSKFNPCMEDEIYKILSYGALADRVLI